MGVTRQTVWNRANPEALAETNRRKTAKKQEHLRALKLERGCADCGYAVDHTKLHWHHRPGEIKLFNVGMEISKRGLQSLLDETDKCDVLCAPCHRARHR